MRDLTFQRVHGTENERKDSRDGDEAVERPEGRRPVAREKRDGSQTLQFSWGPANVTSWTETKGTKDSFFREIIGRTMIISGHMKASTQRS